MKGKQFEQFSNEVLKQGAAAVLPQNLPERWLNALLEEAEIFQAGDGEDIDNTCAGLLSAVLVILSAQSGYPEKMEIPGETLMRIVSLALLVAFAAPLLADEKRLARLKDNVARLARPRAAYEVVERSLKLIPTRSPGAG